MKIIRGIPSFIIARAEQKLKAYNAGTARPTRFVVRDAQSIKVGNRYRLFRESPTQEWVLMSHETYNRKKVVRK